MASQCIQPRSTPYDFGQSSVLRGRTRVVLNMIDDADEPVPRTRFIALDSGWREKLCSA